MLLTLYVSHSVISVAATAALSLPTKRSVFYVMYYFKQIRRQQLQSQTSDVEH